jgi:hypothetical protein
VEGFHKTGENMRKKKIGATSIPASGDAAGRAEGEAAPGSQHREMTSGWSEEHAAASKNDGEDGGRPFSDRAIDTATGTTIGPGHCEDIGDLRNTRIL